MHTLIRGRDNTVVHQVPWLQSRNHIPRLERDHKSRYARAREFAWDLRHPDQVGVADRPELRDWKQRRIPWARKALFYAMLALKPVINFGLLLLVARRA